MKPWDRRGDKISRSHSFIRRETRETSGFMNDFGTVRLISRRELSDADRGNGGNDRGEREVRLGEGAPCGPELPSSEHPPSCGTSGFGA